MSRPIKVLKDDAARRDALSLHNRSMLVEAGAGSGKTAVMAGRIALMLAEGVAPRTIAAVTFTELAASELLSRIRDFVVDLAAGHIPPELAVALLDGLSPLQKENLAKASTVLDEITCTTIHGFCQCLIKPYPAEANIDPGAGVTDRNQADLIFQEITDAWLRERLSDEEDGVLAEMVLYSPKKTIALVQTIAKHVRQRPALSAPPASPIDGHIQSFRRSTAAFTAFMESAKAHEPETAEIVRLLQGMAASLDKAPVPGKPSGLVQLLISQAHTDLCTKDGLFRSYCKRKGKWIEAAKQAGLSKTDGERLNEAAQVHYQHCCDAWNALKGAVASQVLHGLIAEVRSILDRYRDHKRAAALLDFDDLIFAARDLLLHHEDVRCALGLRFSHVLVDEFQDTDPLQTEIFWRLCGEPPAGDPQAHWTKFQIRSGALFLVGDPKQAIYRFRGADVSTYVLARETFRAQHADSLLSISTNFRSSASILSYVNQRFEAVLSSSGQPGFTALDPFHEDQTDALSVAALEVTVENGSTIAELKRDAEAEAIAELCARLIGSHNILDRRTGHKRPCRPGDIALLAPTGTDLWRYEEALERRGIPVATQAGKGLYRRQEIQDLIALTRVLADRRDILALGALLRGPLVGLSEEEILDIVWSLPRSEDKPDRLPCLDLNVDLSTVAHPLARDVLERLQTLQRRGNSTTPYDLLSQAVDMLRVRPLLLERHRGHAERALANVDLYLSLSRTYAVRGLRAFAEAMTAAWTDESRAVEGRPDAQEEAVVLFTMHAAKGLEWPIVIPVNTMTSHSATDTAIFDRQTNTFYCKVLDVAPAGYADARKAETEEQDRERVRLWYVAATRARALLILPRLNASPSKQAWISLVDLTLADLPALDVSNLPSDLVPVNAGQGNEQTREIFAAEAAAIAARQSSLSWLAPSRDESPAKPVLQAEEASLWAGDADDDAQGFPSVTEIQGSRERGLVLHKLFEEVLTGEIRDDLENLTMRADQLVRLLGHTPVVDPAAGLSPSEFASCVARTLALPDIAPLRPELLPEFNLYAVRREDGEETATAAIADALTLTRDGRPQIVIDWKSDVAPEPQTIEHYRSQVRAYLDMTGAERGMIVLVTSGTIIHVSPLSQRMAA